MAKPTTFEDWIQTYIPGLLGVPILTIYGVLIVVAALILVVILSLMSIALCLVLPWNRAKARLQELWE